MENEKKEIALAANRIHPEICWLHCGTSIEMDTFDVYIYIYIYTPLCCTKRIHLKTMFKTQVFGGKCLRPSAPAAPPAPAFFGPLGGCEA